MTRLPRRCRQAYICPFCYARRVHDTWQQIDYAFFQDPAVVLGQLPDLAPSFSRWRARSRRGRQWKRRQFPRRPNFNAGEVRLTRSLLYDLLMTVYTTRIPFTEPGTEHALDAAIQDRIVERGLFFKQLKQTVNVAACYEQITVEPLETCWKFVARRILMLPTKTRVTQTSSKSLRIELLKQPTPRQVMRAVTKCLRYPKGLLRGDASRVREFLEIRSWSREGGQRQSAYRMSGSFGAFRCRQRIKEKLIDP